MAGTWEALQRERLERMERDLAETGRIAVLDEAGQHFFLQDGVLMATIPGFLSQHDTVVISRDLRFIPELKGNPYGAQLEYRYLPEGANVPIAHVITLLGEQAYGLNVLMSSGKMPGFRYEEASDAWIADARAFTLPEGVRRLEIARLGQEAFYVQAEGLYYVHQTSYLLPSPLIFLSSRASLAFLAEDLAQLSWRSQDGVAHACDLPAHALTQDVREALRQGWLPELGAIGVMMPREAVRERG